MELVRPGVGFGLMIFSRRFADPSSAFRFIPFSGEGAEGKLGRNPGLLTSEEGRCEFALRGRAGGFGGVGGWSLPIELTISLKRLMMGVKRMSQ